MFLRELMIFKITNFDYFLYPYKYLSHLIEDIKILFSNWVYPYSPLPETFITENI